MSHDNIQQSAQLLNEAHHEFLIIANDRGKYALAAHHICDLKTLEMFKATFDETYRITKERLTAG